MDTETSSPIAERYDVVIVGAGLAGCALAQALALADRHRRRSILLVDLHRGASPRFCGEFIHPRGAAVLDELGFYSRLLAAGAVDVDGFVVMEDAGQDAPIVLDYATLPGERPRGLSVHHKTLVQVMRRMLRERELVDLREGWRVVGLIHEDEGARDEGERDSSRGAARDEARGRVCGVMLRAGERQLEVRCDLVVGADGKGSTVRRLAGIPDRRRALGFTAGVELFDAALSHELHANVFLGGPGPMLCYPIGRTAGPSSRGRYRLTFDLPHALPAKGPALVEHLLDGFVPYLPDPLAGQVAEVLSAGERRLEFAPTFDLPAPPATAPGLALVGDAAGCSHPITASGMTMGLLDAQHLGREAQRRASAPGAEPWLDRRSLRRYRGAHDRYVPTRQALADAIFEAFRGEDEGARGIRRALFRYWRSGARQRSRSLALLACAEQRPRIFLSEYLETAYHVLHSSLAPRHASHYPVGDRLRQVHGAVGLAGAKIGVVAEVAWAQLRPF